MQGNFLVIINFFSSLDVESFLGLLVVFIVLGCPLCAKRILKSGHIINIKFPYTLGKDTKHKIPSERFFLLYEYFKKLIEPFLRIVR